MRALRNEIIQVKELKKRFVTVKFLPIQLSKECSLTIEKTVIEKLGFSKVIGLHIVDIKNPRWTLELSKRLNTELNPNYLPEYITKTKWLFR